MIQTVGIMGSGKMGSDIFNYLSDFNFKVIWYTRNQEHKEVLKNTYRKKIKRQLKHAIISKEVFELRENYQITTDINNLANCDLIIESVIEELDVKQELLKKLEGVVKPSCILASNSSSILPSELSDGIKTKNRVVGLHFFFPIVFKNVVEIVSSEYTDEITMAKTKSFLDSIKRFYIEQNENDAFILNRFLLQIQIESFKILKENKMGFRQFDDVAKEYIPEFGLFEMMDHVGHNTMYNAILNYSRLDSDKKKYEPILKELQTRKAISEQDHKNLFYNEDKECKEVGNEIKTEISNRLKNVAEEYLKKYTADYNLNVFSLKKGLEEFCGIVL